MAGAVHRTRGFPHEAHAVDRCNVPSHALDCRIHILCHLAQARQNNHIVRPEADGRNAIACPINIYQNAILGNGIGAGQIVIAQESLTHHFTHFGRICRGISVNDVIIAFLYRLCQPHIANGHGATPCDTAAFRNEGQHLFDGFCRCGTVVCFKMAAFQLFQQGCAQKLFSFFLWCHR